jgi:hypothetical protein
MVELTADEFEQLEHLLRQVLNEATARGGPNANTLHNAWKRAVAGDDRGPGWLAQVKERHPALKERVL